MEPIKIGVINISDRASAGIYEDIPGKAVVETLKEYLVSEFETVYKVIPDEQDLISETLKYMSDTEGCCLIVTTGGTGPAKRDVTPEATLEVSEKLCLGISEAIRNYSMTITKRAMLSRAVSVIRKNSLIINMPGSPKAVEESLEYIIDTLDHALKILQGDASECARK